MIRIIERRPVRCHGASGHKLPSPRYASCWSTGKTSTLLALLDVTIRLDSTTYPPRHILDRLEPGMPPDEAASRERAGLWSELRRAPGRGAAMSG